MLPDDAHPDEPQAPDAASPADPRLPAASGPSLPDLPPAPLDRSSLLAWLARCPFGAETHDHPPVFTVAESGALHRDLPGGHTKNLFVRDKKGQVFLVTAEQSTAVDLKGLHRRIGAQGRLSFGKPELLLDLLGVEPGSVTALALVNDRAGAVRFVLDERLLAHEHVNCHPLLNDGTTTLRVSDLVRVARHTGHEPLVADLTAGPR